MKSKYEQILENAIKDLSLDGRQSKYFMYGADWFKELFCASFQLTEQQLNEGIRAPVGRQTATTASGKK